MNFVASSLIILSIFFSSHVRANEYFSNKLFSSQNINFALGVPIFRPFHSFTNTFAKEIIVQMDYRKEYKNWYSSSIFRVQMELDLQARMKSVNVYSGLRFPHLHRKTPFYFGFLFGVGFAKNSKVKWPIYLKVLSAYKLIQLNRNTSALIEVGVQYMLRQENWWRRPASISLFTVVDFNI